MKEIKFYSQEEFFLYWNGHLQPTEGRSKSAIIDYLKRAINLFGGDLSRYTVKSNYADYNASDFINANM